MSLTPLLIIKHKENLSAISIVLNKSNLYNLLCPCLERLETDEAGDSFGVLPGLRISFTLFPVACLL